MKRSDMVQVILLKLDPEFQKEYFANYLLELVEECGMAPPETIILPDSYNRAEGEMGYRVHQWDEEDEA